MDVASQNIIETIFDYYDREENHDNNFELFEWRNASNMLICEKEKLCDGTLYEFENSHINIKLYRFIAFPDKIIRFKTNESITEKISFEKNDGFLDLFFPLLTLVKDKTENICGFTLKSHNKSRTFFSKNRNEIKKWYLALTNCCLLDSIKKDFTFLNIIGSGNFSNVSLAVKNQDGSQYAVKTIYLDKIKYKIRHIEAIINEIRISKMLNHPNVTKLYEVYYSNSCINLIFEYLNGGELFEYLDTKISFSEEEAKQIIKKLVSIIKYIHSKGIIHRDLKPENILLENREDILSFKIADFGLSIKTAKNQLNYVRCGSPGFVAPESLNMKGYNEKTDIFSLGVIAFILLTGSPPFQGDTPKETLIANKICNINFDCEELKKISPEAFKFLKDTLEKNPSIRISAEQAENHSWFLSNFKIRSSNSIKNYNFNRNFLKIDEKSYLKHSKTFDSPQVLFISNHANKEFDTPELKPCNEILNESKIIKNISKENPKIEPKDFEEMQEIPEEYNHNIVTDESLNYTSSPQKRISAYQVLPSKKLSEKSLINQNGKTFDTILNENKKVNLEHYTINIVKDSASRDILFKKGHLKTSNIISKKEIEKKITKETNPYEDI